MKKIIQALVTAALAVTVLTSAPGTAQAGESGKPKVVKIVQPFIAFKYTPTATGETRLVVHSKKSALGKEARKRVGLHSRCLRLEKRLVACYSGTTSRKPLSSKSLYVEKSRVKSNRWHVYRFTAK